MSAEYVVILVCRKVLAFKSKVLVKLNIGAESDKTVYETIYTTASFQVSRVCWKLAVFNICLQDEFKFNMSEEN